ncbi:quinolinate synthase [Methanofollis sp. W23]|uniref:quinolinate synthase NadA n=1 Tax=Methanofollis sp. W23 TaxID=2817849 RepID=UPI001D1F22AE|nr:quinolinate synthase NadA [Methanofollis sp. W23]MBP2145498.1 quinolinate synthase [Methanofollis sp. W23]
MVVVGGAASIHRNIHHLPPHYRQQWDETGKRSGAGDMVSQSIKDEIARLKSAEDAVIIAHNYQVPEVQEVADLVGDSLELARAAAVLEEETIVFCGVDFMAETAAVLAPEKRVLLPAVDALCPMAGMVTAAEVRALKERYPTAAVVCYVNTPAEVKAESDICCTSANAVAVVESLDAEQVIFVPDRNLGRYVARFTAREVIPWEGFCYVHDLMSVRDVEEARRTHPDAEVLVHPECRPEVIDAADHVFSTSGMIRHVCSSSGEEFVIGTETGILYPMQKKCPGKRCYPLSEQAVCASMKKTDLPLVRDALERLEPRVTVPPETAERARVAIERMLEV